MASTPKVVFTIGTKGLERAHVIYSKGEADAAVRFYERLVPELSRLERVAREMNNGQWKASYHGD
jgi:hypothetical protein